MLPVIAIAGRPNVGKSTLYNRLTGRRFALVQDTPGVTRDWREGEASISDLTFTLLDTAGLEDAEDDSLQARMTKMTENAVARADAILMVVDGRAGITPEDAHFARRLRKTGKPIILLVNKAEGNAADATLIEAHRLGLGAPIAFSAEHGEGLVELYGAIQQLSVVGGQLSEDQEEELLTTDNSQLTTPLQIAIVGRPNAGKSTLVNTFLKEERVLTGPEAGITRDAIAVPFTYKGKALKLVDTAGMRRKANVKEDLEKMAVGDSLRAIRFAQVVIVLLDAETALEKQDNAIAALIEQEGRAAVIAVNKWDKVEDKTAVLKEIHLRIGEVLPQLRGVTVVPISAEKGTGLGKLMEAVFDAYNTWNMRVPTAALNRFLEEALARHAPPLIDGRRLKIRYMTQIKTRPPSFALFCNLSDIPDHYMRYLTNGMREAFNLPGVPIRVSIRKNKNPYEEK